MTAHEFKKLEIDYIVHTLKICQSVNKGISSKKIDELDNIRSYIKDNEKRINECIVKLSTLNDYDETCSIISYTFLK